MIPPPPPNGRGFSRGYGQWAKSWSVKDRDSRSELFSLYLEINQLPKTKKNGRSTDCGKRPAKSFFWGKPVAPGIWRSCRSRTAHPLHVAWTLADSGGGQVPRQPDGASPPQCGTLAGSGREAPWQSGQRVYSTLCGVWSAALVELTRVLSVSGADTGAGLALAIMAAC